ncbi:MAG: succinate-semialdehyde dehydrogenase/glutarate-semialdehyde dehydrogenase [Candidatus Latescibacterota bacterium]|jgi:succinate-semialdehyde dehydrogenase / glutarate-semialdehyde dehydrogenase
MAIVAINPATGETVQEYEEMSAAEAAEAVGKAHAAYLDWKRLSYGERALLVRELARVLRVDVDEHAQLITAEMGKSIVESRAEIEKCAWACEYYAEHTERILADEVVPTEAHKSYIAHRPLGVVLAVMPWNFPYWQVLRFAAPAVMAGNAGVLKHASNVPGSALAIEKVFRQAGFPEHLFRTLLIGSGQVAAIIENPHVRAVTLTGSTPAGRAVATKAGEMLKKTVLELGGSDPYIILEDADLAAAAASCVAGRLGNAGQSCVAAKRFVVVEAVREEFEALVIEGMKSRSMGDPLDESIQIGPMARHDLRDELHEQVQKSIEKGARCLLGGEIPENKGAYYPPTLLTDVVPGMPAYSEEFFGPVASVISVKDEAEAISVANSSVFGLGGAVFTRDIARGERIAKEELESGCCFVNDFVRSDPRLPFGGVKESGYGRELSDYGMKEFVNTKTVYIK